MIGATGSSILPEQPLLASGQTAAKHDIRLAGLLLEVFLQPFRRFYAITPIFPNSMEMVFVLS
jgi:hypothetical protein